MPDPMTLIAIGSAISAAVSAGGLYKAAQAQVELTMLAVPIFGEVFDAAFNCGEELPPEIADELHKLD